MHQLPLWLNNCQPKAGTAVEIIMRWNPDINPNEIKDIEIVESWIFYTYEWEKRFCDPYSQEVSKCRAVHANMIEIQYEIDRTLNS